MNNTVVIGHCMHDPVISLDLLPLDIANDRFIQASFHISTEFAILGSAQVTHNQREHTERYRGR